MEGRSRRAASGPDEIERQSPAFVVNLEGSHKADIKMPQEIAGAHVSAPKCIPGSQRYDGLSKCEVASLSPDEVEFGVASVSTRLVDA